MSIVQGRAYRAVAGLSLLEFLMALVVASVLLAIGLPALSNMLYEARLRGAADNLQAYLRYAWAESMKRERPISVAFVASGSGAEWCYGLSEAGGCDCGEPGSCLYDGVERVVRSDDYRGVGISVAVSNNRFSFQPRRNTVTAGHVNFVGGNNKLLRIVVSGYGRVRACSPAGEAYMPGQAMC